MQYAVVPVNFSGVDTKTDPKAVIPGNFLRLENGVFTRPNQIAKRNGHTAFGTSIANVGTLTNPQLVHGYGDELIAADQNKLLSYSASQDAWISKGGYTSTGLARILVSEDTATSGISDMAILGNYAVYCWSDLSDNIFGSVVDLTTNTVLVKTTLATGLTAVLDGIKCVCLAGTTLCAIYRNDSTSTLRAHSVTFSGSGVVSFSAGTTIASTVVSPFDVIQTATGGAFVYQQSTTPGITVATLSTALAVTTVNLSVTTGFSTVVAISSTSNNNIWIYWTETTNDGSGNLTALSIYYAVYSATLVPVLVRTLVVATASPYYVSTMMAKADSATQETLYYGVFTTNNNGTHHMLEYSKFITVTSAGVVGSSTLFANGVIPFSHPFTIGARIYAVFMYRESDITVTIGASLTDPDQPTFFIVELTNLSSPPLVVARFASGVSNTDSGFSMVPVSIGNVASFSGTKVYFSTGVAIRAFNTSGTLGSFINSNIAVFSYAFDFASTDANRAINSGEVVLLSGAVTQLYDGGFVSEFNFHLTPEITNLTQGSGGSMADGSYNYLAIFQWTDSKGNLHQSAPSFSKSITVTSGSGSAKVTATITTNFLSQKPNAQIALYRTQASGSIYYLVSGAVFSISALATTNAIVTFIDGSADATIIKFEQAYTFPGSSVLENTTPPPSFVMASHNNRVFFVDAENPDTTVWYTKSGQPLVGISPSGFMTQEYDPKFGNIASLAELDEKLVILKQNGIMIQSGDGVSDTGNGSTFSFPQIVPSDVGCSSQKSVILTPEGIFFKSVNGIYFINRSLNVGYLGAEVEAYNSQDVTGATLVPGKSQIRFLTSSGLTLVYDYIFKKWSTFTNHTGTSSTAWNSLYVYATTGINVFKESLGSYLDNATPFALLAQTSWLSFASIQGFQRVRRLIALGDYVNGNSAAHNISIAAAYDFSSTFQPAVQSPPFGAISTSNVFQYRERLPIQKCDSVSLLIQEDTTGSAAEYIDITNISFEVGIKKGVNKLGAQYSVG